MTPQNQTNRVKSIHPVLAGLLSVFLLMAILVFAVSFCASLFGGPAWLSLVIWPGLLLAVSGMFLIVTGRVPPHPHGLSGSLPWLKILDVPLQRVGQVAGVAWIVSVPTLLLAGSFSYGGIEGSPLFGFERNPVFAPREVYQLVSHGAITEVSRLRFLIVGTGMAAFVYASFVAVALAPLYAFLFGDRFDLLKASNPPSKNAEPNAAADGGRAAGSSEITGAAHGRSAELFRYGRRIQETIRYGKY